MLARRDAAIKLDWDAPRGPNLWTLEAKLLRAGYLLTDVVRRRSPGGSGWHVIMEVVPTPTSAMEVVALQAILGGDPWREAMQMHRARAYAKVPAWMRRDWNVLYRPDTRRARHLTLKGV